MKTMKAAVITDVGTVEVQDIPVPELGQREVLIKIGAASICSWEHRTFSGKQKPGLPFFGGHENAGEVVAVTEGVTRVKVGDRVTLGPTQCGTCRACLRGEDKGCPEHFQYFSLKGGDLGPGGFSEYKVHREDGCFPVGDAPFELACLAEPLSCAVHAIRLMGMKQGDTAVVFGAGPMGLLNALVLHHAGVLVTLVDMEDERLQIARDNGINSTLLSTGDAVDEILALYPGGVDGVVTAIGSRAVNEQGLKILQPRGTLCLFASAHPVEPLAIDPNWVHNTEVRIIGAVSADIQDHERATEMIAKGEIDLTPIMEKTFPLADAQEAFEYLSAKPSYRVALIP
ncbi:MAG: zinc-dependent alcohol dehydrogenase [Candidatus Nanopelagicales bacterium]|jgi:L-iditol 2-dehydrogenase|tara:strand:+ start:5606 stop:6631 length:1026 start_codon:yes stop_codon:yes gene_type:complete